MLTKEHNRVNEYQYRRKAYILKYLDSQTKESKFLRGDRKAIKEAPMVNLGIQKYRYSWRPFPNRSLHFATLPRMLPAAFVHLYKP